MAHKNYFFLHPHGWSCVHPTLETTVLEGPPIGSGNFTSYTTQK